MLLAIGELGRELPGAHPVDLGPDHPSRVGLVLVEAALDEAGVITHARVQPGFSHRGAEKLFEVRDYRQVLMLADRHDWQSPAHGELGTAMVTEHLMGLPVPERALVLRTLLAEFSAANCLLAHLSWVTHRSADVETAHEIHRVREMGRELSLRWSGNRVHPMLTRLGGIAADVDAQWVRQCSEWANRIDAKAAKLHQSIDQLPLEFGVLGESIVNQFGLSGPVARAAGLARDVRMDSPLAHSRLGCAPATSVASDGSARSRLAQLVADLGTCVGVVRAALAVLDEVDGPINTPLAKIIKAPESEAYLALEAPWGLAGFHLVSRGERTPWRLHLRTPSFANAQALEVALVGCPVEWVDLVVASLGWTIGDLDK